MSVQYYTGDNLRISSNLIDVGIFPTIRHFMHTSLYPNSSPANFSLNPVDYPRFIRADIEAQSAFEEQQAFMSMQNYIQPFTAFSIGEQVSFEDRKNHNAKSFHYFSTRYNSFISTRPMQLEIPLISFFPTPEDYFIARSILEEISSSSTILYSPVVINSVPTQIPINISFEISKGNYAHEFEEQLAAGDGIWDIVHTATVDYWDITVKTGGIFPIDSFDMGIFQYKGDITDATLLETVGLSGNPAVSSTSPIDDAVDVSVATSIILNFNIPMVVDSVENAIGVFPAFDYNISVNDACTIFTIEPINDLDTNTLYTITVDESAQSLFQEIDEDYIFSFTTVEA